MKQGRADLAQRLREGGITLGGFVRMPVAESVEVFAFAGYDFVVLDAEHTAIDDAQLINLVRAAEAVDIPCVVRVPDSNYPGLNRILDVGPAGIQFPQVGSTEAARSAIASTKYQPLGHRGLSTGRATGFGLTARVGANMTSDNESSLVILQLETRHAVRDIDSIARLPGCDVLFIGLTDLSADLGVPGDYEHPAVVEALSSALAAADRAGIALGVPAADLAMASRLCELGARYVVVNDIRVFGSAAKELREGFWATGSTNDVASG